jgi:hypothetical protein
LLTHFAFALTVLASAPPALAHWVQQECECEDAIADAEAEIAEEAIIEAMDDLLDQVDACSELETAGETLECVKEVIRGSY